MMPQINPFSFLFLILLFNAIIVIASPTLQAHDPSLLFGRSVGDTCKAPEGSGTCQNTSDCPGISYLTGLCPHDPKNVQCCVNIKCTVSGTSGYCRSVSNNGCSGGKFTAGHCPGNSDIQCCTKTSTPAPAPNPNTWPTCQQTLSCTFAQIQSSSMQERLTYVRFMESNFFGRLGAGNQFRAIEGVITFFINQNIGKPGSWISYVDTGIIEAIQYGGAIALGMGSRPMENPGTAKWAAFFNKMKSGGYAGREEHDYAWGDAEATATEWSKAQKADAVHTATRQENNWYQFTKLFRWIMRHETQTTTLLIPFFGTNADNFVRWLTNITSATPTIYGSEAAWAISGTTLDFGSLVSAAGEIIDLIKKIYNRAKSEF